MDAHRRSRLVRLMLSALTATIILATALGPLSSPGSEAKGNAHHGHGQHQATERGTETGSHHQVASARTNKKGHSRHKKKGGLQPRQPGQPGSIFNPTSPTAPTVRFTTETEEFTNQCIAYLEPRYPPPWHEVCFNTSYQFNEPTPVQIEVIPTLPCGTGKVWITTFDGQPLASRQGLQSGVSTGVIDLGTVKDFEVVWQLSTFEGCGPIPRSGFPYTMSVTIMVTHPTPIVLTH